MPVDSLDPDLREEVDLAISAVNTVMQCADLLKRVNDATDPHLYAMMLHVTSIDLLAGCIALAETERVAGIPILLRSMYEALVDLDNLVHTSGYHKRLEASNLKEVIKTAGAPALGALFDGSMGRDETDLQAMKLELEVLVRSGNGPLDFKKRCSIAGRVEEYESLYRLFCLDSHNNLAALADRHMNELQPGQHFEVSILGNPNPSSVAARLRFGVGFLIQSAEMIHGAFGTTAPAIQQLATAHKDRSAHLAKGLHR